jgi:hypothetical protein
MGFPPAEARVSTEVSMAEEDFTAVPSATPAEEAGTDERKSSDFGKSIEEEANDASN